MSTPELSTLERALRRAAETDRKRRATDTPQVPEAGAAARENTRRAATAMPDFPDVPYDPNEAVKNRIQIPDTPIQPHSTARAAYRVLRTRLLQRVRANEWNAIGVTSPGQGEGKTVTSLNLALSIAREANNNVFLIDLDMRNPSICKALGAAPPTEITTYLAGNGRPERVFFSLGIQNLTLAGSLTSTEHASELLASDRVESLFEYIRGVAPRPLILVDLPPLLSTDDALIIAPKVNACLLVISEGKTRRDGAAKALDLLAEFNLAGIVLNRSSGMITDYYSSERS